MRTIGLSVVLFVGLVGCGEKGGGGGGGGEKKTITKDQISEAYKLTDPDKFDKSMSAVTDKLGAPHKTEGDTSTWYGATADGKSCYQLKMSKTKGMESGTTDKANCGIK